MIVSIRWAVRAVMPRYPGGQGPFLIAGEDLTMADGSVWFHPYGGQAPVKVGDNTGIAPSALKI